jgi:vesicle-fusing ATPase
MLLFGPPGCGKTLIARQIGKVLNAREPKIVNGPEILNKFVGGSEEKVRELFADAEKEQLEMGDHSMLHIIILDEMDAICKSRGANRSDSGVSDSVVNQLLSKIDGVDSLNNILLIGMTNRKDMIDDALLRPGRLEVHVEIGLPDHKGRLQILGIHTKSMSENKRISPEVMDRLGELSEKTKNFSGAEIEGLVKAATSYALTRCVDVKDLSKAPDDKNLIVRFDDFQRALDDVSPKFGAKSSELKAMYRNGFVPYGDSFDLLMGNMERLVEQGEKYRCHRSFVVFRASGGLVSFHHRSAPESRSSRVVSENFGENTLDERPSAGAARVGQNCHGGEGGGRVRISIRSHDLRR